MNPEDVRVFDLHRILIGDLPWTFTAEIALRTVIMWLYTFGLVRALTRRTVGQLSLMEVLLIVALGSAVGDPMFYPDVPVIHGIVVITVVVAVNRGIGLLTQASERAELLIEGRPVRVVHLGVLEVEGLRKLQMARDQLFDQLRLTGVEHLGQVRAAYFEQNGHVSVFRFPADEERPGYAIEPPPELDPRPVYGAGDAAPDAASYACAQCGRVLSLSAGTIFAECACESAVWERRVREPVASATR